MLISVTNLDGQTEPLNNYRRPEIIEEVNGAFTLAVTSFFVENNPGHILLDEESIINVDGYDFRVKKISTLNNRKEAIALSTFFDLIGHRQELIYGGTRTLKDFLTFVFGDTGWTFSTDIEESQFIPNFGEDNVIKLSGELTAAFECEYQIMPNNHVHFAKEVGPDNDAQYRYGHNVRNLTHVIDTHNLRTQITGIRPATKAVEGKEGVEAIPAHDGFKVTYTSPFAEKYGTKNRIAEPIINDEIRTETEMVEFLKRELKDYPDISTPLDSVESTEKEIGERVWVIYEPIQLADGSYMEFQARVMKKTSTIRKEKLVTESVVLGNAIPRTMSDIINGAKVEIDKNSKWTRSRIEQTNSKITLAVEEFLGEMLKAYSLIELTAREIRMEVAEVDVKLSDGIAQNKSSITQTASQIRQEVNEKVSTLDGRINTANSSITQTARDIRAEVAEEVRGLSGSISSANAQIVVIAGQVSTKAESTTVTDMGRRVSTAEQTISALDGKIESKVTLQEISGEFIVSRITQTASSVKIQAKNIELEGIVRVANSIDLGFTGSGGTKAIKFNGYNAWIYSDSFAGLTLDASYVKVLGELTAYSPHSGQGMPVITGTTANQRLTIGLTTAGVLNVYRPDGSVSSFSPN